MSIHVLAISEQSLSVNVAANVIGWLLRRIERVMLSSVVAAHEHLQLPWIDQKLITELLQDVIP